jgi:hypothetical protein
MELSPSRGNVCAEKRESTALECLWAAHSTTFRKRRSATRAVNPARDFQTSRAVSRSAEGERSKPEVERETGDEAPSTNRPVEFIYRLR